MTDKIEYYGKILKGALIHLLRTQTLDLAVFDGKRVAVIGPASSAYEEENGQYIDNFDVVVRINRSLWQLEKRPTEPKYVGTKTTVLFHQLMEESLHTGELNEALLKKYGLQHLVFSRSATRSGVRKVMQYYSVYPNSYPITLLDRDLYRRIAEPFGGPRLKPTNGYNALFTVLESNFRELYISGITFYRTPYAKGYRDDADSYQQLLDKGWHNPDVEFENFKRKLRTVGQKNIILDNGLKSIL